MTEPFPYRQDHDTRIEEVSHMIDAALCSCGWEGNPYFDGVEWATDEALAHRRGETVRGEIFHREES